MEQALTRPDLALGAGFSYAVVTAHNGALHLEVQVDGRSAHAAMPFTGVDALEAATGILSALYDWRGGLSGRGSAAPGPRSPPPPPRLFQGGPHTNTVPPPGT